MRNQEGGRPPPAIRITATQRVNINNNNNNNNNGQRLRGFNIGNIRFRFGLLSNQDQLLQHLIERGGGEAEVRVVGGQNNSDAEVRVNDNDAAVINQDSFNNDGNSEGQSSNLDVNSLPGVQTSQSDVTSDNSLGQSSQSTSVINKSSEGQSLSSDSQSSNSVVTSQVSELQSQSENRQNNASEITQFRSSAEGEIPVGSTSQLRDELLVHADELREMQIGLGQISQQLRRRRVQDQDNNE